MIGSWYTLHYITLSSFQTPLTPKVTSGASTIAKKKNQLRNGANCSNTHNIIFSIIVLLICHYFTLHVLFHVLLRSLFLLKRTRSLTLFIPISHVRYIYAENIHSPVGSSLFGILSQMKSLTQNRYLIQNSNSPDWFRKISDFTDFYWYKITDQWPCKCSNP